MCGILGIFNSGLSNKKLREKILQYSRLLRHRGPDWSGVKIVNNQAISHERLSIIDPISGKQPLMDDKNKIILSVNGEIYNYKELKKEFESYEFKTKSDCEVIIPLYLRYRSNPEVFINLLSGMFSFILYDIEYNKFLIVRDHIGICPLYYGIEEDNKTLWFSSEMKALQENCYTFYQFPPGNFYYNGRFEQWYKPLWINTLIVPQKKVVFSLLREKFEKAVKARMMSDVPWGVLLSGGLDSSLVASVASRYFKSNNSWFSKLHSFTIGLPDSSDLIAARKVSEFLGTVHHEFTFTLQEGLDVLHDVIYHLETFDVTTIRASTPMFLMSRKIKSMGIKMVLSGEGSDEIFGGYLYFHKAPNKKEFHKETIDKVNNLYYYDCLRANKSTCAWGLEVRVPFLDKDFVNYVMSIDPEDKMITNDRIEKWVLRKTFDDPDNPYLPDNILWRQKEQFSDGVGYSWIDCLKDTANKEISDEVFSRAKDIFPINTPMSKEAFYYRKIFSTYFEKDVAAKTVPEGPSIACSTPAAIKWDESFSKYGEGGECSGRAISVHNSSY